MRNEHRGLFFFEEDSVVMKKWQILEFDGKPYYAYVPQHDEPIDVDTIPTLDDDEDEIKKEKLRNFRKNYQSLLSLSHDLYDNDTSFYDCQSSESDNDEIKTDVKPILLNGIDGSNKNEGDLYQVKVNGNIVTIEKFEKEYIKENKDKCDIEKKLEKLFEENESSQDMVDFEELEDHENLVESKDKKKQMERKKNDEKSVLNQLTANDDTSQTTMNDDSEPIQEVPEYMSDHDMNSQTLDYITEEDEQDVDDVDAPEEIEEVENPDEDETVDLEGLIDDEYEEEGEEEEAGEVGETETSETVSPLPSSTNKKRPSRYRPILPKATGVLKCKACSETFSSPIAFRKHVAWTHKKKICIQENGAYICSVCDYKTVKKALFATHLERKHETWPKRGKKSITFPCGVCGFVCRSKHSLQSHFVRKHTDKYEHQCKFCPKKFKVKGDLTNHIRFHHREKPVACNICNKLCQNSGSLYVHQKWAHYKPKFECPICKRRMVTQENLDQHIVSQHEKREKIICQECGKTFTKKDSFKRHMAVHTGSKPHSCLICSRAFARQSQLRQHVLIHTGKRPFVCDLCPPENPKAFTQKPGLICHRKTHPGVHPPLPVMPIADFVNEFTSEYLQENPSALQQQKEKEQQQQDGEQNQEEENEDEEREEEQEEGEEEEEEVRDDDLELDEGYVIKIAEIN